MNKGKRKKNPTTPNEQLSYQRQYYYDNREWLLLLQREKRNKLTPSDKERLEELRYEKTKKMIDEWNEQLKDKISRIDDDYLLEGWRIKRALQLQLISNIEWLNERKRQIQDNK